jgi:hypothetical protein
LFVCQSVDVRVVDFDDVRGVLWKRLDVEPDLQSEGGLDVVGQWT